MSESQYQSVMRGCLDNLPSLNSRLVRIFISSTFTDTREERNLLLESVYPKLKTYCKEKHGLDFQLVDMRWGVPSDATNDHQATNLCREEIYNCQKLSTGPNFVTFLNQKYGYKPLQTAINVAEFETLLSALRESGREVTQLLTWFKRDDNNVPPMYVLQPISSVISGYKEMENKEAQQQWDRIYNELRDSLKFASQQCFDKGLITKDVKHKYFMSVTEDEIFNGILNFPGDPTEHCLCFVRIIEDLEKNLHHPKAWRFIDMIQENKVDEESQQILSSLRDEKINQKLKDFSITKTQIKWSNKDGVSSEDHKTYLESFAATFFDSVVNLIDKAVQREQRLNQDDAYIEVPLIYHKNAVVVLRFLGTSPDSSNLWKLLRSLSDQISVCYNKDKKLIPDDLEGLKSYFLQLLECATPSNPLVILLDSLDQLSAEHKAHRLNWLPPKLPKNVHMILSAYTEARDIISMLKLVFLSKSFISVPVFSAQLSTDVLKSWLKMKNRTLTSEQFNIVEDVFRQCSLPLFVKLIFDQVLAWKSYTPLSECRLESTVQNSIQELLSQLEKKHGPILVSRAMAYVTASSTGISEVELEDLLSLDDIVLTAVFEIHVPPFRRIPPLLWVRIRHDISQYLVDKEVDTVRVFFWYHRQFFEASEARYLKNADFSKGIHSLMADYYLGIWHGVKKPFTYSRLQMTKLGLNKAESEEDRKVAAQPLIFQQGTGKIPTRYNKRKLNRLPYHLHMAGRRNDLYDKCLFNYIWLNTKLEATSVSSVLLDYIRYEENKSPVHKALKAAQSTLNRFPQTLAAEISGRLLAVQSSMKSLVEMEFLKDSLSACARTTHLVPYQPCYTIPSDALICSIEHPTIPVNSMQVIISENSKSLVTLTVHNEVITWDITSGEMEKTTVLSTPNGEKLNVMHRGIGSENVIVGTTYQKQSNPIFIMDLRSGNIESSLIMEKNYPAVGFIDDLKLDITSKLILITVLGQAADVYDKFSGKLLQEFNIITDQVVVLGNGEMVLYHTRQSNIYSIHSLESFLLLHQFSTEQTPKGLFMGEKTPVGCVLVSGSPAAHIIDLDPKSSKFGEPVSKIYIPKESELQLARIYGDKCLLITADKLILWDIKTNKQKMVFTIPQSVKPDRKVLNFEGILTPDLQYLVATYEEYILIWSVGTGKLLQTLQPMKTLLERVMLSPDGQFIICMFRSNNAIMIWNLLSVVKEADSYRPLSMDRSARYVSVALSGTSALARSTSGNEFISIDVLSGRVQCSLSRKYSAMEPKVTPDGNYAMLRSYDEEKCIKIWNMQSGQMESELPLSGMQVKHYISSFDSKKALIVVENDITRIVTLKIYSVPSGGLIREILVGRFRITEAFFADKDKYIVLSTEFIKGEDDVDMAVKVYETESASLVYELPDIHPESPQPVVCGDKLILAIQKNQRQEEGKGEQKWKLIVFDLGENRISFTSNNIPEVKLKFGNIGRYGIDRYRWVYDLKKGVKSHHFDSEEVYQKEASGHLTTPKVSADEKFAIWVHPEGHMLKLGSIALGQIVGVCPLHSIPMNLSITPQNIILIGCEDGRIMLVQLVNETEQNLTNTIMDILNRSKVQVQKVKRYLSWNDKNERKKDDHRKNIQFSHETESKFMACTVL
ncbi:hypothetical protein CHS0354_035720 [Potamilus streckersoni]|uniref:NACHT and WD repeat domain-containing protein 2 n=1 Tax=Potamilus streckersoni TaxID=2493646 RepID=A0AAE0S065_9BIVA|nr:hypothetical protein CHS0354_035720 [Potamilus streckersoni]